MALGDDLASRRMVEATVSTLDVRVAVASRPVLASAPGSVRVTRATAAVLGRPVGCHTRVCSAVGWAPDVSSTVPVSRSRPALLGTVASHRSPLLVSPVPGAPTSASSTS